MFKLESLGMFLVEGRDLGWLRRRGFRLNVMFSGYVYFFVCIAFLPSEKRKVYLYRLVTSLPLIILTNSMLIS